LATNPAEGIVPPYSRYNIRSSLSQEQIPLRKLFLPIAGSNSAAEIVPPYYSRYNFHSSLSQEQILLRKLFLPITGTTSAANFAAEVVPPYHRNKFCCLFFFFPIAGANSAAEVALPFCSTNSGVEVVPAIRRNNFLSGICSCDREERNLYLL